VAASRGIVHPVCLRSILALHDDHHV